MRLIVLLAFLSLCHFSFATNYYVAANGNDNNSGTSPSSPWKTINKVNSFTFKPGDQILFNRGDEFYGGIVVKQSGTSSSPITFGAYGSGAKPVITGFTKVTSWTNLGGNIWESTGSVSTLESCNMVVINGENTPMGRWPNNGWITYESANGTKSITSNGLNGSVNWTGAQVVIRKYTWIIDVARVTSHSGNTINYNGGIYAGVPNNGFFIQNDARTLDSQNEWYYNPNTKKLRIYSNGLPNNVKIPTVEHLVSTLAGISNLVFDNLKLTGANSNCILIDGNVEVTNCDIQYAGNSGIITKKGGSISKFIIDGNSVSDCNNLSISYYGNGSYPVSITNNTIKRNGLIVGASPGEDGTCLAINASSANGGNNISYNRVDSVGYNGINFTTGHVHHNYITNFCLVKQDGGGIYTAGADKNTLIEYNIVGNGKGDHSGMAPTAVDRPQVLVHAIYNDRKSSGAVSRYNTIYNISGWGFHFNDPDNLTIQNNTIFNVSNGIISLSMREKQFSGANFQNNIFCVPNLPQSSVYYMAIRYPNNLKSLGIIDNNYFLMANKGRVFNPEIFTPSYSYNFYDLTYWKNTYNNDKNSQMKVVPMDSLKLEINPTSSSKIISLGGNYSDVKGNIHRGTITLEPYTSMVLMWESPLQNQPPIANAGPNQSITLPLNSTTLKGSGTASVGGIKNYYWTKLNGPEGGNILNPHSQNSNVTDLLEGTYKFVLKVTDDNGMDGYDTVEIVVNPPAGSNSKRVIAGDNQSIILPLNTVYLNGNFEGGNALSYLWTKISGPNSGVINKPSSASTSVTDLIEGEYVFQLEVKEASGKTYSDKLFVFVSSSNGLLPSQNPSNIVGGLDYSYYEGNFLEVPDFSRSSVIKKGNISGFDLSVANRSENFALDFNGYIDVPTDGQYTFYTSSDDGSLLYIDGKLVVDNNGKHGVVEKSGTVGLKAGKHAISVGYFQSGGGKVLDVSYSGPGMSKRLIPTTVLYRELPLLPSQNPSSIVGGLDYSYYEGNFLVVPDFSRSSVIKKGTISGFDLSVANRSENFALDFNGYIDVPTDGQYTFYTSSDDGSLLYIDGRLVVDNNGKHGVVEKSGTVGLKAGKHAISVGYFQSGGGKVLDVSYSGPGMSKRLIPTTVLYRGLPLLPSQNPSSIVGGLDYSYYEGNFLEVPDFSRSSVIKKGTVSGFDLSVANRSENFALDFNGYIDVPTDGQYTFYTSSDDGSLLYIDGRLVVDNNGKHGVVEKSGTVGLKAGKHAISVGYFQSGGGKVLNVSYSGPGMSKRLIPTTVLYRELPLLPSQNPSNIVGGLDYSYYEGNFLVVPDFSRSSVIKKGTVSGFDLSVANRSENFALDFNGYIDVPTDGQYTFYTSSDDGSLLYIDGKLVVDNNGKHGVVEKSGTVGLKAGKHAISVGYFQSGGGKVLDVSYAGPGISKRLVASGQLFRISTAQSRTGGSGSGFASTLNTVASDSLNKQELAVSGLAEKAELNVFPNPFVSSFVVSLAGESGDYKLHLMDVLGRTIWIKSGSKGTGVYRVTIDGSSLGNGVYFLKVVQGKDSSVFKLKK